MARIGDADTDLNMSAFGGDVVTNPFERFSTYLALAVGRPERFRLGEVLTGFPGDEMPERHHPPRGHWIMCGYGRFGHGIREALTKAGNEVTVIDRLHYGEEGVDVKGTGTDSASLIKAGIEDSVGIVMRQRQRPEEPGHRPGGPRPETGHLRGHGRTRSPTRPCSRRSRTTCRWSPAGSWPASSWR